MNQSSAQPPTSASQFASVHSTNEVPHHLSSIPSQLTFVEIDKNAKCLVSMPSDHTCTVTSPNYSPLKHAKSHYSLGGPRASTPTGSPSKAGNRSRAGTPVGGRPSSAGGGVGGEESGGKTFTFDHCLWSVDSADEGFAGQEKLYEVLGEEFLRHSLEGYNCCIFACPLP